MKTVCTENMTRDEWIKFRKNYIGGSDAAAIIGLNPFVTPYSLWAEKTDRLPEREDTEAMRQGRDLEQYVADRFTEETGLETSKPNEMYFSNDYPFAMANIDRWIDKGNIGLECKTTSSLNLKRFKNGEYPNNYYVQCVHYMAVTGAKKWYLAALVLNKGFYVYEIERDEQEINSLMDSEQEFYENYIKKDAPPPVDGFVPTTDAINTVFNTVSDFNKISLFGREKQIEQYFLLRKKISEYEQMKEQIEQELKLDLGEHEQGVEGKYLVSWKKTSRCTFDSKRFAEENPHLNLNEYYKTKHYRRFNIKEMKEETR